MGLTDENIFSIQRRNLILISLSIILFNLGAGEVVENTNLGFLPFKLKYPSVLETFVAIAFFYFAYRFWVCGGRNIVLEWARLKRDMFISELGWERKFISCIHDKFENEKLNIDGCSIENIKFDNDNYPTLATYDLIYKKTNSIEKKEVDINAKEFSGEVVMGIGKAAVSDPRLSEYMLPIGLAAWASFYMIRILAGNIFDLLGNFLSSLISFDGGIPINI